jgi:hypothetical protein
MHKKNGAAHSLIVSPGYTGGERSMPVTSNPKAASILLCLPFPQATSSIRQPGVVADA